jgi:hypothetical protein
LHLVGILFPHIIDDARSKPHQIDIIITHNGDDKPQDYRKGDCGYF